jgi:hypothetical protein
MQVLKGLLEAGNQEELGKPNQCGFCGVGSETLVSIPYLLSKNSTKEIGLATFLQENYST